MENKYNLYYTFLESDSGENDIRFTKKNAEKIKNFIKKTDDRHKEAFFMLIIEHARCNEDWEIPSTFDFENCVLPYKIKYFKTDSLSDSDPKKTPNLQINTKHLPKKLKNILLKFCEIGEE